MTDLINYNNPIELVEIFRISDHPEASPWEPEDPMLAKAKGKVEPKYTEYSSKTCVGWERILAIKEYPYEDNWKKFKGPKFWVTIDGSSELMLVYGNYDEIKSYWIAFRNKYPLFTNEEVDKRGA